MYVNLSSFLYELESNQQSEQYCSDLRPKESVYNISDQGIAYLGQNPENFALLTEVCNNLSPNTYNILYQTSAYPAKMQTLGSSLGKATTSQL
ncbi:hypothetical protein E4T47_07404 [Aureobasidium subglaciale]|nr:hypothetical protein E4T47_07404 [Aureobasidium subglaciale]